MFLCLYDVRQIVCHPGQPRDGLVPCVQVTAGHQPAFLFAVPSVNVKRVCEGGSESLMLFGRSGIDAPTIWSSVSDAYGFVYTDSLCNIRIEHETPCHREQLSACKRLKAISSSVQARMNTCTIPLHCTCIMRFACHLSGLPFTTPASPAPRCSSEQSATTLTSALTCSLLIRTRIAYP